ncbi:glycosyltransferase family 2 protein [Siminovitchia acidinfaciens]|uniref:Glycosyltransferase family 2 protein n=1 Tax=Siminovitchia acidinfaciens TaxID=2321395 RepID=A0A429XZG7_9BACI|nr:glycosyltransferase family 2 protein [Siminovitchia acidinfaciens]RST74170.1 glycosyltransferase family 2 protein [Siminovitchia acidinfaciens]
MLKKKKVAIIILNWNSYNDTYECLKSLESLDYSNYQVFLVDNDSQDNSYYYLKKDYDEGNFCIPITFIQTGANLGFAGGNNVAIKKAYEQGYEYIWLLNNDTVVKSNALTPLVETMESDNIVGIVGSKILYYNTNKIWFAGGKINNLIGTPKHIGINEEDINRHNSIKEVDYITGCSLLIRRSVIEKIGLMDEHYFLYFEETDWNIRAKQFGFKILFNPQSIIWHKVSQSTSNNDSFNYIVYYYSIRNNIYLIKKYYSKQVLISFLSFSFIRAIKTWIKNKCDLNILKYSYLGIVDGMKKNMGNFNKR